MNPDSIAAKAHKERKGFPPLRLERGESDATLAQRIPFSASDGEKVAKPDEVFPGSGEGLGVRVSGEVSPRSLRSLRSLAALPHSASDMNPLLCGPI
jgi:hypothetical protein